MKLLHSTKSNVILIRINYWQLTLNCFNIIKFGFVVFFTGKQIKQEVVLCSLNLLPIGSDMQNPHQKNHMNTKASKNRRKSYCAYKPRELCGKYASCIHEILLGSRSGSMVTFLAHLRGWRQGYC